MLEQDKYKHFNPEELEALFDEADEKYNSLSPKEREKTNTLLEKFFQFPDLPDNMEKK